MFKRIFNELSITLDLAPDKAPLLIKSGREAGADPTLLDLNFVRSTNAQTKQRTVFLPGSSLKGTLRSYCERVARTVRPEAESTNGATQWCCDPFKHSCADHMTKESSPEERYARSCVACRTFGNTRMGSHLLVSDAFPNGPVTIEQRDGVAIDRVSGAVAAGPFNMEVVTQGTFRTTITLRNFQLWQVGWVALALRDLGAGNVPLGSGKSKGFGRMALTYVKAMLTYHGQMHLQSAERAFADNLYDLNAFATQGDYALAPTAALAVALPAGGVVREQGEYGRVIIEFSAADAISALLTGTLGQWRAIAESGLPQAAGHA